MSKVKSTFEITITDVDGDDHDHYIDEKSARELYNDLMRHFDPVYPPDPFPGILWNPVTSDGTEDSDTITITADGAYSNNTTAKLDVPSTGAYDNILESNKKKKPCGDKCKCD